jgi:hypothetical protein
MIKSDLNFVLFEEDRESQSVQPSAAFGSVPKQKSNERYDHLSIDGLNHGEISAP